MVIKTTEQMLGNMEIKTTEQILGKLNKTNPVTMHIQYFDSWLIEKEKKWCSIDNILKRLRIIEGGRLESRPELTIVSLQRLIKELEET